MTDNVIILGAGASVDAGIPVLANFVEKMWEFAISQKNNGQPLSDEDKKIFTEAIDVKNELDSYHGRAAFDDRNIEDILSILSFNLIGNKKSDLFGRKKSDREKLIKFTKAIARTIELTCQIKHNGNFIRAQEHTTISEPYLSFWKNLFNQFKNSNASFPTIISFNYDLVLERTLFQSLVGLEYSDTFPFPFDSIQLKYNYSYIKDKSYDVKYVSFSASDSGRGYADNGTMLEESNNEKSKNQVIIEFLKLHGSLNFPKKEDASFNPVNASKNPNIMPPIINKWVGKNEETIWSTGLQRLKEAKNIIIIGYSLPRTDIYMQYFLRAGIGPNVNLNKITVFNPTLFRSNDENQAMRERFGSCFSPQLRSRIEFNPSDLVDISTRVPTEYLGTFLHFIYTMDANKGLFFGNK